MKNWNLIFSGFNRGTGQISNQTKKTTTKCEGDDGEVKWVENRWTIRLYGT